MLQRQKEYEKRWRQAKIMPRLCDVGKIGHRRRPSALNRESAASCDQLVAGTRNEQPSSCPKDDSYNQRQEEGAFKYAGDFEYWHHSFPTAQILAQRAVATLSPTRKCQKSIYFFLVLRHINGNFSTSTCIQSAITRAFLVPTGKIGTRTALRCIARAPQGYVLAQSSTGSR
jgi:hypothetical protein